MWELVPHQGWPRQPFVGPQKRSHQAKRNSGKSTTPHQAQEDQRKARIQQHAIGEPAAAPLAAPMPSANLAIMPPVEVEPLPLIDLPEGRVLSSFVEPLNSFLTHDDLPGAIGDFFNIMMTSSRSLGTTSEFAQSKDPRTMKSSPDEGSSTCSTPGGPEMLRLEPKEVCPSPYRGKLRPVQNPND
ncbi:hypothetical protein TNCT_559281 [Trichonephila clavata]|uniref:Uncharacterized protein n=1 Tax=Trichonephila clavata TaxID=2740835 RepID=A0A8X6LXK2_TRICU|nr:hypothetical protein TNCT_559281 [Trichonephila clavata]